MACEVGMGSNLPPRAWGQWRSDDQSPRKKRADRKAPDPPDGGLYSFSLIVHWRDKSLSQSDCRRKVVFGSVPLKTQTLPRLHVLIW
jgi:hypothetical protein